MSGLGDHWSAMLVEGWTKNEPCTYFSVVEDLLTASLAPAPVRMKRPLWRLLPEELMERVLLFLPATSQARFAVVCKRWRELMSSSEFRDQSALIAFHSTDSLCMCSPEEPCDLIGDRLKNIKVVRFGMGMFSKELIPCLERARVLAHGGLLGLAVGTDNPKGVAVFVFNPVIKGSRRELPRVMFDPEPFHWECSLVSYEKTGFQVFLAWRYVEASDGIDDVRTRFCVYSSATHSWSDTFLQPAAPLMQLDIHGLTLTDFVVSKGGFVHVKAKPVLGESGEWRVLRLTVDGKYVRTLPAPPKAHEDVDSPLSHLDASHSDETLYWVRNTCTILKCGSKSRMWKLVSRLPKSIKLKMNSTGSSKCELDRAKVVGDLILLVCIAPTIKGGKDQYVLAYHIVNDTWTLVCRASYFWECKEFLAPRPGLVI